MVADQAHAKRNLRFQGIADGGGNAGIRNGNDDVRIDGMFARQETPEHFPTFVDGAAENDAIRPRKIDMLENALLVLFFGREMDGFDARLGDAQHFAGLDFADVLRVEQIEGAGFRGDQPGGKAAGSGELAENERTEAARIADRIKLVLRENEK